MRIPRRSTVPRAALAAAMAASTLVGLASPASAASYVALGSPSIVAAVQWAPAADRIFTTRWDVAEVKVYDLDGTAVGSIAMSGRGWDMDLVGGVLYVALYDQASIAMIDASTLDVIGYLDVGTIDPSNLAVAGGRAWFSAGGTMTSVDVADDTDVVSHAYDPGTIPGAPRFASVPGSPGVLLAWDDGDPSRIYRFDVSDGAPVLADSLNVGAVFVDNVVVDPDGTRFYYSYAADPDVAPAVGEVRMSDMVKVRSYSVEGSGWLQAVAVSPDGGHIAFADQTIGSSNIWVFAHAGTEPVRTIETGQTCLYGFVAHEGLSFGPDDTTLSTVQTLERDHIVVYDDPTVAVATSSMTLEVAPETAAPGDAFTVYGQLSLSSGSAESRTIKIWRQSAFDVVDLAATVTTAADGTFSYTGSAELGSPCFTARFQGTAAIDGASTFASMTVERLPTTVTSVAVPTRVAPTEEVRISGTVSVTGGEDQEGRALVLERVKLPGGPVAETPFVAGADGTFSIVDHPTQEGEFRYQVAADETDRWAEAHSAGTRVTVAKRAPSMGLTVSDRDITWGDHVKVTLSIPSEATNQQVKIFADPAGAATRRLVFEGSTGGDGVVTISPTPTTSVTYEGVFAGDERYAPRSVERDVGVHTIVVAKMLKASGTSGVYETYHADQRIFLGVRVRPDEGGRRVTIDLQRNVDGAWKQVESADFKLRDDSTVIVFIEGGVLKVGSRWRFVAIYSRLPVYTRSQSPYAYFKVVA